MVDVEKRMDFVEDTMCDVEDLIAEVIAAEEAEEEEDSWASSDEEGDVENDANRIHESYLVMKASSSSSLARGDDKSLMVNKNTTSSVSVVVSRGQEGRSVSGYGSSLCSSEAAPSSHNVDVAGSTADMKSDVAASVAGLRDPDEDGLQSGVVTPAESINERVRVNSNESNVSSLGGEEDVENVVNDGAASNAASSCAAMRIKEDFDDEEVEDTPRSSSGGRTASTARNINNPFLVRSEEHQHLHHLNIAAGLEEEKTTAANSTRSNSFEDDVSSVRVEATPVAGDVSSPRVEAAPVAGAFPKGAFPKSASRSSAQRFVMNMKMSSEEEEQKDFAATSRQCYKEDFGATSRQRYKEDFGTTRESFSSCSSGSVTPSTIAPSSAACSSSSAGSFAVVVTEDSDREENGSVDEAQAEKKDVLVDAEAPRGRRRSERRSDRNPERVDAMNHANRSRSRGRQEKTRVQCVDRNRTCRRVHPAAIADHVRNKYCFEDAEGRPSRRANEHVEQRPSRRGNNEAHQRPVRGPKKYYFEEAPVEERQRDRVADRDQPQKRSRSPVNVRVQNSRPVPCRRENDQTSRGTEKRHSSEEHVIENRNRERRPAENFSRREHPPVNKKYLFEERHDRERPHTAVEERPRRDAAEHATRRSRSRNSDRKEQAQKDDRSSVRRSSPRRNTSTAREDRSSVRRSSPRRNTSTAREDRFRNHKCSGQDARPSKPPAYYMNPSPTPSPSLSFRDNSKGHQGKGKGKGKGKSGKPSWTEAFKKNNQGIGKGGPAASGKKEKYPKVAAHGPSILVSGLSIMTSPDSLREYLQKFGRIKDVYLPLEYKADPPRPKGFGFVEFIHEADAQLAIDSIRTAANKGSRENVLDNAFLLADTAKARRKKADQMKEITGIE
ncbi:unnamed protein product [Amoebophrya sp. A25]|nr:unnamed protein product [Amoebophrya sp. A25]|eukprot:GSA25T00001509001.1